MTNIIDFKKRKPIERATPQATRREKVLIPPIRTPPPTPQDFKMLEETAGGPPQRAQILRLLCMGHELTRYDALYHVGINNIRFSATISALRNNWGIPIAKRKKAIKTNRLPEWLETEPEMTLIDTWRLPENAPLALYYNILLAKGYRRPNGDKTVWPA
ncbi:MAG: hypothetical protein ACJA1I_001073 [Zhongshania marina]|jgi:hypothetical protein